MACSGCNKKSSTGPKKMADRTSSMQSSSRTTYNPKTSPFGSAKVKSSFGFGGKKR